MAPGNLALGSPLHRFLRPAHWLSASKIRATSVAIVAPQRGKLRRHHLVVSRMALEDAGGLGKPDHALDGIARNRRRVEWQIPLHDGRDQFGFSRREKLAPDRGCERDAFAQR